jgi:hypothetical protein
MEDCYVSIHLKTLKKTAGEGDVLEFTVQADEGMDLRELNAIELIPAVTVKLKELGLTCSEIKMRANTLEDVFIQLTGKRLRE